MSSSVCRVCEKKLSAKATNRRRYCNRGCRDKFNRFDQKIKDRVIKKENEIFDYVIVCDPSEYGAFCKGAVFPAVDFNLSLENGVMNGIIVKHNNKKYRVHNRELVQCWWRLNDKQKNCILELHFVFTRKTLEELEKGEKEWANLMILKTGIIVKMCLVG